MRMALCRPVMCSDAAGTSLAPDVPKRVECAPFRPQQYLNNPQRHSRKRCRTSCSKPVDAASMREMDPDDPDKNGLNGFYSGRFYKLVPAGHGETTFEIDGIKMHISQEKSPSQGAKDKVKLVKVRKKSVVLDICTGLGYSAIACIHAGAAKVVTLEKEPEVLNIARQNPQSAELFTSENIVSMVGDASEIIQGFPDETFNQILHDPPRISLAGQLYSLAFYKEMFRVLKSGGRAFHYTGTPNSKGATNGVPKGVKERLIAAGFLEVKWVDSCQGFKMCKL